MDMILDMHPSKQGHDSKLCLPKKNSKVFLMSVFISINF